MEQNYFNGNNMNTENTGYTPTPETTPVQQPMNASSEQSTVNEQPAAGTPQYTNPQLRQNTMNVPPYTAEQTQQNTYAGGYNGGYGYQQYNAVPVQQPASENKKEKRSKGKLAKVMALVAAVAIVGGGAGFGGQQGPQQEGPKTDDNIQDADFEEVK